MDWEIINGKVPILIVASHAYSHIRNNKLKLGDRGTGYIARVLCKKTGSWGIISTHIQQDPNFHPNSKFRSKVIDIVHKHYIKAVIDIHGSANEKPLVEMFINRPAKDNLNIIGLLENAKEFKTDTQTTISEQLEKEEIPAIEVELSKSARVPHHNNRLTIKSINQNVLLH